MYERLCKLTNWPPLDSGTLNDFVCVLLHNYTGLIAHPNAIMVDTEEFDVSQMSYINYTLYTTGFGCMFVKRFNNGLYTCVIFASTDELNQWLLNYASFTDKSLLSSLNDIQS